jgi:hypothetical protein
LKLIFLDKDKKSVQEYFPEMEVIEPFGN